MSRFSILSFQFSILNAALLSSALAAAPALRSGPQVGDRPLPFTSNMVTGEHRGKQFCYVCELKDEPSVLVFARHTDAPTARLLQDLRDLVQARKQEKLFGWMVFLGAPDTASQTGLERRALEFARTHGATSVILSALGDPQGPPGYRIAPEAEVTVIGFRSGKVLYNRAYGPGEWNERSAAAALKPVSALIAPSPEVRPRANIRSRCSRQASRTPAYRAPAQIHRG